MKQSGVFETDANPAELRIWPGGVGIRRGCGTLHRRFYQMRDKINQMEPML